MTARTLEPRPTRISRRDLLAALAAGLLGAPLGAAAQAPSRIPRIGVIGESSSADPILAGFRQGLLDLGYVEGRNIAVEYRYARGLSDPYPKLAAELISLGVDLIVVGGTVAALAVKAATTTVPIVFTQAGDPVGSGLVASLARPGGNATGLSNIVPELSGKQLELLKAAVPHASRIGVLYNPVNPISGAALDGARRAAHALALELRILEVRTPSDLAGAFATLTAWRPAAVLALSDPVFGNDLPQLSRLATKNHLPAMYARREFAEAGGLLAYGPNFVDNYRRAATYVDKILKGARAADLPVELPTRFELVINLKTARALGLTIPPTELGRADHLIR